MRNRCIALWAGAAIVFLLTAAPLPALARAVPLPHLPPATGYDRSWFATDLWSGEWLDGFSVEKPVTIEIRTAPNPKLARTVACHLVPPATYHPWNYERVVRDTLIFLSYQKISDAVVSEDFSADLEPYGQPNDAPKVKIDFHRGDRWRSLAAGPELGSGLIEFRGRIFVDFESDLGRHSTFDDRPDLDDATQDDLYQEWLNLPCANGVRGWLFMLDTVDVPELGPPNQAGFDVRDAPPFPDVDPPPLGSTMWRRGAAFPASPDADETP